MQIPLVGILCGLGEAGAGAPFRSIPKMKLLLLSLATLITCGLISPTRGELLQLKSMIEKITKKSVLNYVEYGCYCGWGGQGQPLDATDRCCQIHDCCYEKLENHKCSPKVNWYNFSIRKGQIHCGGKTWCEKKTCQCDKKIALCLRRVMNSYHPKYQWYKKSHCKSPTPPCSSLKF